MRSSTIRQKQNYQCIREIIDVDVCEGLENLFKEEWNKRYGLSRGTWDDTCISGNELYNIEKARKSKVDQKYLDSYKSGKSGEWDCPTLFDAILFSNALKSHVSKNVQDKVHELRELRNFVVHPISRKNGLSDVAFENAYNKIIHCFKELNLSTADIEKIRRSSERRISKTERICLVVFTIIVAIISCAAYFRVRQQSGTKLLFQDFPTRPYHLIANRSSTVSLILEELQNLSVKNNRSLTHFYITGNPGSDKSQLARLVGQRYGRYIKCSWFGCSSTIFVVTLNGRSVQDILESYVSFARRVDCNENAIETIRNSNKTTIDVKIRKLQEQISKILNDRKLKYTWLLIVDNVVKLCEISAFLPLLEDEDWKGGQVLVTTQDMSCVPPNSSLTVHISVSQGMGVAESNEFLTDLSGLIENQELVDKVAKDLDYQPLAMASGAFYVKLLRESKVSPQFNWKDYLKKLDEGKRNLTEIKLSQVNQAYCLTMSTAVLMAVQTMAESDSVLKHAFTFFSFVSPERLSLQVLVSYVLHVDKNTDKEDVALRIKQCSLFLTSDDSIVVAVSLHRVVHDNIKLYISHDTEQHNSSRVPLNVLQLLPQRKCKLGEMTLIPHLKDFLARTKNLTSENLVPKSVRLKQKMHKVIFDLTWTLLNYGEFVLARNYLTFAMKIATNGRGKEKHEKHIHASFPKLGEIILNLGVAEMHLGNFKQARKYYKKALNIFLKQYGQNHTNVWVCYENLGSLSCSNPEECNESEMFSNLALKRSDKINHTNHTLALFYEQQGGRDFNEGSFLHTEENYQQAKEKFLQAKEKYIQAAKFFMKPSTNNDIRFTAGKVAKLFTNLGGIDRVLGLCETAKVFLKGSISIYQSYVGSNHLELADPFYNLGLVHHELNELTEAEKCFKRAIEICSKQLKPSHEKLGRIKRELALALEKTGRSSEAAAIT